VKRLAIQLVLVFIGTVAMTSSALSAVGPAETRLALVVTNQQHEFAPLAYSHADGEIVSAALREVGFDVHVLRDGTKAQLRADLDAFVQKLKDAGEGAVAFFYFSGHCWANSTSNFVVMNEHLNEYSQRCGKGAGRTPQYRRSGSRDH
jgi:Caspase domain